MRSWPRLSHARAPPRAGPWQLAASPALSTPQSHTQHRRGPTRSVLVMDKVHQVAAPALHLALAQEEGVGAAAGRVMAVRQAGGNEAVQPVACLTDPHLREQSARPTGRQGRAVATHCGCII